IDPEEEADRSSVPTDWQPPGAPGVGCLEPRVSPFNRFEGTRPSSHVHQQPTDRPTDRSIRARGCIHFRPSKNNPSTTRSIVSRVATYMLLVTGTTECATLGQPFGSDGGNGGPIPIARRWRSHGGGFAFSARFAVAGGRRAGQSIRPSDVENSAFPETRRGDDRST
ncbi:hypothetical protein X777_07050, partial [Ooceraea biroi]